MIPEVLEAIYQSQRIRYRTLSEQAMGSAALSMDLMAVNGVKKRNISYDRYNPWFKALKRLEAGRIWRYRTTRILKEQMQDLPLWVKDSVDWESVSLIQD